eukprot:gene12607-16902_t
MPSKIRNISTLYMNSDDRNVNSLESIEKNDDNNNFPTDKHKLTQMFIDLGQKSFGQNIFCKECNFFYCKGDDEDEVKHKKFCLEVKGGVIYNHIHRYTPLHVDEENDYSVILLTKAFINHNSNKHNHETEVLDRLFKVIEREIGFSNSYIRAENKIYICISKRRVIGCLVIEQVKDSQIVHITSQDDITNLLIPINTSNKLSNSSIIYMGVRLIWTDRDFRKHGIASLLLDVGRRYFEFGRIINKTNIAFSQPTNDGYLFATRYCNDPNNIINNNNLILCYA